MKESINDIFFLFKSLQLHFFCFMAGADKSTVLMYWNTLNCSVNFQLLII